MTRCRYFIFFQSVISVHHDKIRWYITNTFSLIDLFYITYDVDVWPVLSHALCQRLDDGLFFVSLISQHSISSKTHKIKNLSAGKFNETLLSSTPSIHDCKSEFFPFRWKRSFPEVEKKFHPHLCRDSWEVSSWICLCGQQKKKKCFEVWIKEKKNLQYLKHWK